MALSVVRRHHVFPLRYWCEGHCSGNPSWDSDCRYCRGLGRRLFLACATAQSRCRGDDSVRTAHLHPAVLRRLRNRPRLLGIARGRAGGAICVPHDPGISRSLFLVVSSETRKQTYDHTDCFRRDLAGGELEQACAFALVHADQDDLGSLLFADPERSGLRSACWNLDISLRRSWSRYFSAETGIPEGPPFEFFRWCG